MPYSCQTFGLKRPLASERLISRISQHPTYVKQISLCSGIPVTRPDITIIYITENLFSHNSSFNVTYAYTYIAYLLQQFIEVFNKYFVPRMHLHWERSNNSGGDCCISSLSWMGKVPEEIPEVRQFFYFILFQIKI